MLCNSRHETKGVEIPSSGVPPLGFVVTEITNRCNLRCPHCASNSGPPREDEFSLDEWKRVLDDIKNLGGKEISLLGGEIFLNPDWYEIGQKINQLEMDLNLITNGLLVTDPIYEKMNTLNVNGYGISLDGASREIYKKVRGVDGFDKAFGLLKRLITDGYPFVNAITTFSTYNWDDFDNFIPLLRNTGINWQIQLADSVSKRAAFLSVSVEDFEEFFHKVNRLAREEKDLLWTTMDDFGYFPLDDEGLPELHEDWYGCMAGVTVLGIRANGDVLPCLSMGDDFVIANIRERSLPEIWADNDLWSDYRQKYKKLQGGCASCAYSRRCRAGCSAMAYTSTDSIFENHYCMRAIQTNKLLDIL